ncbi:helix-turn-helix domain-containing protein [Actinomadura kijaniata]|uniref:helix-turn-helix domain-containing protein n=1 Tax=Actinomadura kijaniata TaxID=46161 RepID=UPI000B2EACAF|nr:helix-turn-helix transcriptional regulator [Actinomadura kijaniata]
MNDVVRPPVTREPFSGLQREIMVLLAAGLTDAAVAARLRVSQRTVQRHVRRTMAQLDARTRFELGIRLAELRLV